MKYFAFKYSWNLKEIGHMPQGALLGGCITNELIRSLPFFEESKVEYVFDHLILHKKAKLTSLIDQDMLYTPGIIMSDEFYNLTRNFNFYKYQIHKVYFNLRDELHKNYQLIAVCENELKYINFSNSELYFFNTIMAWGSVPDEHLKDRFRIDTEDELLPLMRLKGYNSFSGDKIVFQSHLKDRDVFFVKLLHNSIIISERFCEAIIKAKMNGFRIEELPFKVKFE